MDKKYLVLWEKKCPQCEGCGVMGEPLYADWGAHMQRWRKDHPDLHNTEAEFSEDDRWWSEKGFPGGPHHWPPEEWGCEECAGSGILRGEAGFDEALADFYSRRNISRIRELIASLENRFRQWQ